MIKFVKALGRAYTATSKSIELWADESIAKSEIRKKESEQKLKEWTAEREVLMQQRALEHEQKMKVVMAELHALQKSSTQDENVIKDINASSMFDFSLTKKIGDKDNDVS